MSYLIASPRFRLPSLFFCSQSHHQVCGPSRELEALQPLLPEPRHPAQYLHENVKFAGQSNLHPKGSTWVPQNIKSVYRMGPSHSHNTLHACIFTELYSGCATKDPHTKLTIHVFRAAERYPLAVEGVKIATCFDNQAQNKQSDKCTAKYCVSSLNFD